MSDVIAGPIDQVRLAMLALYHAALEFRQNVMSFQHLRASAIPVAFGACVKTALNSVSVESSVMKVLDDLVVSGGDEAEFDAIAEDCGSDEDGIDDDEDGPADWLDTAPLLLSVDYVSSGTCDRRRLKYSRSTPQTPSIQKLNRKYNPTKRKTPFRNIS